MNVHFLYLMSVYFLILNARLGMNIMQTFGVELTLVSLYVIFKFCGVIIVKKSATFVMAFFYRM
jgi:hypothetical protein